MKTDGNNPLGGGFADKELQPGLYQLTARGNMAPWPSFGAAKTTWETRAEQLCGKGAYQEILETQDAGLRGDTLVYFASRPDGLTSEIQCRNQWVYSLQVIRHDSRTGNQVC